MAKANITQYSSTPSENTDIDDINIDELCPASNLNNALRSLLSHLKNVDTGSQALTALSVTGDLTVDTNTLYVDSTNNRVGIGNASPSAKLDAGGHIRVTGGNDCDIEFQSGSDRRKFIGGDGNELELGTFSSNNTSRDVHMRINSNGDLLVGATTARTGTNTLSLEAGNSLIWFQKQNTDLQTQVVFNRNTQGTSSIAGTIQTTGTTVSYNTSSDYRLKENISYDFDATTRLKQLKPARFNWIQDETDTTVDGFLAHEVSSIVPEAISGTHNEVDDDGNPVYQGIDQSKLVPLLVKTIQELEARITALENS